MTEIGLGRASEGHEQQRLLNKDGTFNIVKLGTHWWGAQSLYDALCTTTWRKFFLTLSTIYLFSNLIFASAYFLLGPGALAGVIYANEAERFMTCFFFSIQTFATIGYGVIHPIGGVVNSVVALESLVGILEFAVFTGLTFTRFSRPQVNIIFSQAALIAPYKGGWSLQFRVMNLRKSQLLEPEVQGVFSRVIERDGVRGRDYFPLTMIVNRVMFMPLYWTVTHQIDEKSPLWGITDAELSVSEPEYLVSLSAIDEVSSEKVYLRTSYRSNEIVFKARFRSMYLDEERRQTTVVVENLSKFDKVA